MIAGLYIAVVLIGYLLGSIPFGVIIGRFLGKTDIRSVGSGKTGMTNVMRAAGKKGAALSLVCDAGKGVGAVLLSMLIFTAVDTSGYHPTVMYFAHAAAALAAIAGHSWSVFLGFKGGRGVSTFFGAMLVLYWPAGLVGGFLVLLIGGITRYMSLGSIVGSVAAFIMLIILNYLEVDILRYYPHFAYVVYAMIGSVFIYAMHRDNIRRLVSGQERKIGEKKKAEKVPTTSRSYR